MKTVICASTNWHSMSLLRYTASILTVLAALALQGCASLAPRNDAAPSWALPDAARSSLGQLVEQASRAVPQGHSGFRLLPDGPFSLEARRSLARHAERSIDVQYYLLRGDAVGSALLRDLRDAALRGVRVRLLLDDLHVDNDDELLLTFATHPNVQVRLFNPLAARGGGVASRLVRSLGEISRINHRMHNKLFIADGSLSVSGGRNVGNEYFMQSQAANFIDVDILAAGPVVRQQLASFDQYWNSDHAYPLHDVVRLAILPAGPTTPSQRFDALTAAPLPVLPELPEDPLGRGAVGPQLETGKLDLIWAQADAFADNPAKITRSSLEERFAGSVTERTLAIFRQSRSSVVIVSPYFIPGAVGMDIIRETGARGVKTTLLTNSLGATDEPLVHGAYAQYRREMLELGVSIYELSPTLSRRLRKLGNFGRSMGRLHAKLAIVDNRYMMIGSMNLDGRSASLNTEVCLQVDSPELVRDFQRLMDENRFRGAYELRLASNGKIQWIDREEDGTEAVLDSEPGTTLLTPFKRLLITPLLPEELL